MSNQILHTVFIIRVNNVEKEEDKEGDDTSNKAEQLSSSRVIETIVVEHAVVIKSEISSIVASKFVYNDSYIRLAAMVIIGFPAARVIFVSEYNFCHSEILLKRQGIRVCQIIELCHFVLEVLGEYVHPGN